MTNKFPIPIPDQDRISENLKNVPWSGIGVACRDAMHGFAALPSTIMDAKAVKRASKAPASLVWRQPKAASRNGGLGGYGKLVCQLVVSYF